MWLVNNLEQQLIDFNWTFQSTFTILNIETIEKVFSPRKETYISLSVHYI